MMHQISRTWTRFQQFSCVFYDSQNYPRLAVKVFFMQIAKAAHVRSLIRDYAVGTQYLRTFRTIQVRNENSTDSHTHQNVGDALTNV